MCMLGASFPVWLMQLISVPFFYLASTQWSSSFLLKLIYSNKQADIVMVRYSVTREMLQV